MHSRSWLFLFPASLVQRLRLAGEAAEGVHTILPFCCGLQCWALLDTLSSQQVLRGRGSMEGKTKLLCWQWACLVHECSSYTDSALTLHHSFWWLLPAQGPHCSRATSPVGGVLNWLLPLWRPHFSRATSPVGGVLYWPLPSWRPHYSRATSPVGGVLYWLLPLWRPHYSRAPSPLGGVLCWLLFLYEGHTAADQLAWQEGHTPPAFGAGAPGVALRSSILLGGSRILLLLVGGWTWVLEHEGTHRYTPGLVP